MSSLNVFDGIIVICGLYMAVNGILMKTKGKINAGLVFAKNSQENKMRDREGFIKYMWWKLMLVGILCAVAGVTNIICSMIEGLEMVDLILNAVFFALLIVYGIVVTKAQKDYM